MGYAVSWTLRAQQQVDLAINGGQHSVISCAFVPVSSKFSPMLDREAGSRNFVELKHLVHS
jgi:hypothetical protein